MSGRLTNLNLIVANVPSHEHPLTSKKISFRSPCVRCRRSTTGLRIICAKCNYEECLDCLQSHVEVSLTSITLSSHEHPLQPCHHTDTFRCSVRRACDSDGPNQTGRQYRCDKCDHFQCERCINAYLISLRKPASPFDRTLNFSPTASLPLVDTLSPSPSSTPIYSSPTPPHSTSSLSSYASLLPPSSKTSSPTVFIPSHEHPLRSKSNSAPWTCMRCRRADFHSLHQRFSCESCNYDECQHCLLLRIETEAVKVRVSTHRHLLEKFAGLSAWKCVLCRSEEGTEDLRFRCEECNFDECHTCIETQLEFLTSAKLQLGSRVPPAPNAREAEGSPYRDAQLDRSPSWSLTSSCASPTTSVFHNEQQAPPSEIESSRPIARPVYLDEVEPYSIESFLTQRFDAEVADASLPEEHDPYDLANGATAPLPAPSVKSVPLTSPPCPATSSSTAVRLPEILREELILDNIILGRGIGGFVQSGLWRGCKVAVKTILVVKGRDSDMLERFLHECSLLARTSNHGHVIKFIGCCTKLPNLMLVSQYCENGSVLDWLAAHPTCDLLTRVRILKETAAGLLHLHAEQVVHRDIAARNVLLDKQLTVYVTDFGMARVKEAALEDGKTASFLGPIKWYVFVSSVVIGVLLNEI